MQQSPEVPSAVTTVHRLRCADALISVTPELIFADWHDLAAKGRVADAVVVAVLDDLHAEVVSVFAQKGYHILCEKPMATSVADCVNMVKEVQAGGGGELIFGVGHGVFQLYCVSYRQTAPSTCPPLTP
jgi:predicted dehydrogenase